MKKVVSVCIITLFCTALFGGAVVTEEDLFFKAVREGDTNYVTEVLDEKSVDIDVKDAGGMTALMIAVEMENLDMIKTLAVYKPSITAKDSKGRTPITIAAATMNTKVIDAVKDIE